ncbi:MAG: beta-1,6-N-acetylglucosaminyltransferase [Boseongicola sp.]|nr:beta-1,6-N-acetylglucosaminyltransferase [Boseongicola sp.]NNJ66694.1 glycosyl transferase [Boseongicola sp.]
MATIAFILLCHKDQEAITAQAERLTAAGDKVSIHFDARAPHSEYDALHRSLEGNPNVAFAKNRVKCGWGEWSLVAATLSAVRTAYETFPEATHFYLLSGDCMPIKSAEYIHNYLDNRTVDIIESFDFFESDWIKTGFRDERLIYRHIFNERTQPKRYYATIRLQQTLGLKRAVPSDLRMMIGSQWWCLRRQSIDKILQFIDQRKGVERFFRTTWIPDETFFQTLVRHLVPEVEIDCRTPTFLMFSDYGMPVTFYNDHFDLLLAQDYLFARKISAEADELKSKLGAVYAETDRPFSISDEGRRLHGFLTGRGRIGQRFAPRFWEKDATIGRERTLMLVTCKKWHVAKRLLDRVGVATNVPAIEFLFDEEATPLPDLGGIEKTLEKRSRHRRAMVRLLFDYYETDRMILCLDPSRLHLLRDFFSDRCETRLLEIDCHYSDDYLQGHARRVGLASDTTTDTNFAALLPSLRNDLTREIEAIRDEKFPEFYRIRENAAPEENASPLANFLGIEHEKALDIARTDYLFAD